jgi:D-alanyl-D-alanine carboxypeptidase (penicillin-binding protein 5/6)
MTKYIRNILFVLLAIITIFTLFGQAQSAYADDFSVAAKEAIAVDSATGKILYSQNAEESIPIASVSKIISTYVIYNQIKEGKLKWDDQVSISDYAARISENSELSNVPLYTDTQYTVKSLLHSALIESSNSSIIALAEKVAGSEPKFVDMMTAQLKSWGIDDSSLTSSSGLNNSFLGANIYPGSAADAENNLSAKDVAIVARHLIADFPDVLTITATTSETFDEGTHEAFAMTNWNTMLPGGSTYMAGVDGLKTGTTELAGACFVGTINKNGQRIITVVLNATNQELDHNARFVETGKLMDYCYANWSQKAIGTAGQPLDTLKSIKVKNGEKTTVAVGLKNPVTTWVRNDMDVTQFTVAPTIDKSVVPAKGITAPTAKGKLVGTATISLKQDTLGYLEASDSAPSVDIVTQKATTKAGFFLSMKRKLEAIF